MFAIFAIVSFVLILIFYPESEKIKKVKELRLKYESECYRINPIKIEGDSLFDPDDYLRKNKSLIKGALGRLNANRTYADKFVSDLYNVQMLPHSRNPFIWRKEDICVAEAKELLNMYQYLCMEWVSDGKKNYKLYSILELEKLLR